MLITTAEMPKPRRVQAAFISESETRKVTDFIREQRLPEYDDEIISQPVHLSGRRGGGSDNMGESDDELWRDAVAVVVEGRKASTSLLQRRLRIGYARAARLIETMEEQRIVSQADGSRPRDVLISSVDEAFGGAVEHEEDVYDENFEDDGQPEEK